MACSTIPRSTSSKRTTAGKIGKPAASVEVQPSGRSLFDVEVEDRGLDRRPAAGGLSTRVELEEFSIHRIDDQ